MKQIVLSFAIVFVAAQTASANMDNCEVVTMDLTPTEATAMGTAKFHDAQSFIDSVYDAEPGFETTIEGRKILAVMCERDNLLPSMRDLPLVKTGLPLSLSQDFDSPQSGLLTLYDDGTAYQVDYTGPDGLGPDPKKLTSVMEIFNLQRLAE